MLQVRMPSGHVEPLPSSQVRVQFTLLLVSQRSKHAASAWHFMPLQLATPRQSISQLAWGAQTPLQVAAPRQSRLHDEAVSQCALQVRAAEPRQFNAQDDAWAQVSSQLAELPQSRSQRVSGAHLASHSLAFPQARAHARWSEAHSRKQEGLVQVLTPASSKGPASCASFASCASAASPSCTFASARESGWASGALWAEPSGCPGGGFTAASNDSVPPSCTSPDGGRSPVCAS